MSKAEIVWEIVLLLQGTPVEDFVRQNFYAEGNHAAVRCSRTASIESPEGQLCKRAVATALRRYSYRFNLSQIDVLADLYVGTLERLEPAEIVRVRDHMCDAGSEAAQRDAAAAKAVCERLSLDF